MAAKKKDSERVQLEVTIASLEDQLARERADAMNVRRRAEEDKLRLAGVHKANIVRELLPVLDSFERALKVVPEKLQEDDYIKGVQGVVKQFETSLEKIGVIKIKSVGEPFDPLLHDAVAMEDGEGSNEVVVAELQAGYMVGDEVIRPAMVRVKPQ